MCPRLFHIHGPLWINGYGLMIAFGFMLFTYFTYKHPLRKKLLSSETYSNIIFLGFLSAIAGGRLLFVLENINQFSQHWIEAFYPWVGGFSLFGSIFAIFIIISFYLKKMKIPILPFFDLIALYTPLLLSIARIGCFLAGCCYGAFDPINSWSSVTFTNQYSLAPIGAALYPTQLYSSFASFFIFIMLLLFAKKLFAIPGLLFFSYLSMQSIARFTIDFWRGGRNIIKKIMLGSLEINLSVMQLIVAGFFVYALIALIIIVMRKK